MTMTTQAQSPHTWYETTVGEHHIRLGLNGQATTAPQAAIALYQVDASLQLIAQWFGVDPAWQWIENRAPGLMQRSEGMSNVSPSDTQLLLDLPAALEQVLPPPPGPLAKKLKAPALSAQLVAARFRLTPEETGMLEPGGAIMLSESTEANWFGVLRSPETPDRPVLIQSPERVQRLAVQDPSSRREATEDPDPSHQTGLNVEIRLGGPLSVPTMCLRDEHEGEVDLGASQGQSRLASLWLAGDPVAPLAIGELTPLGRGWAMLIEQVFSIDASAQPSATKGETLAPEQ